MACTYSALSTLKPFAVSHDDDDDEGKFQGEREKLCVAEALGSLMALITS